MKIQANSDAKSYLAALPADRRSELETCRKVVLQNLDAEFEEGMQYGMIGYYVPHRVYPAGYHVDPKKPLPFAALAAQKHHLALYLNVVALSGDAEQAFRAQWAKSGKKLDLGKSCIRFKKAEDLALDVIGKTIRATSAKKFIAMYEASLGARAPRQKTKAKPAAAKSPKKRPAAAKPRAKKKA